jgi:hypothetical protein
MSSQFDASFAYTGPLSEEVQKAHRGEVERDMSMPGKLANAKLHANNELQRWVLACNRLVWGQLPAEMRIPEAREIAWLLEQLSPENCERLLKESQLAMEARNLVALLEAAEVEAQANLVAQQAEEARAQAEMQARLEAHRAEEARIAAERALRQQFEAEDEAGKEARFAAWRAARGR